MLAFLACAAPAQARGWVVVASWYGHRFDGRLMSDGKRFEASDPTIAAHRTLPLGTKLKVRNPANGRVLTVIVKDRGPFVKGRGLDLSYAAAHDLGYADKGVARLVVSIRS
ncbi:MAG: septal ring lytic transglycosylase RlpA family protein [Patescibacteria group bacterium]|nr:septal ring lytic transglycosylase RlpA family protein [Patescibacteria group bacterium]